MDSYLKKLNKGFWQVADPKIWVASTVSLVVGVVLAAAYGKGFNLFWMLLSFVGVYFIEIGKNAINECVDYIKGPDRAVDDKHRTPFSGGKKTIVDGVLTVKQSAVIGVLTMIAAAVIGILIALFKEPKVLYVGFFGFVIAIIYSLPPFKLCYRGLGELAVGITFGPLIVNGMYVVMAGKFDLLPVLVSIPIGLLIANVLWINQFPDYEADKSNGKKNCVVRLGKLKASKIYAFIFILTYISIIGIAYYTKNPIWLIAFLTIPKAVKAIKNCKINYDDIAKLIQSNAATVQIYMLTGVLFVVSVVTDVFII